MFGNNILQYDNTLWTPGLDQDPSIYSFGTGGTFDIDINGTGSGKFGIGTDGKFMICGDCCGPPANICADCTSGISSQLEVTLSGIEICCPVCCKRTGGGYFYNVDTGLNGTYVLPATNASGSSACRWRLIASGVMIAEEYGDVGSEDCISGHIRTVDYDMSLDATISRVGSSLRFGITCFIVSRVPNAGEGHGFFCLSNQEVASSGCTPIFDTSYSSSPALPSCPASPMTGTRFSINCGTGTRLQRLTGTISASFSF